MLGLSDSIDLWDLEHLNLEDLNNPLFEKMVNLLPVPFWILDLNYQVIKYNRAAQKFYKDKLSGNPYCYQLARNINAPCERQGQLCPLDEVQKSGKAVVTERKCLSGDGTFLPMEICALPVLDREGRVAMVAEILFDISERKKYLDMLKRYEVLFENAKDIIIMVDLAGNILEANRAAINEYGYTREELLGLTIADIRTPETGYKIKSQMKRAEQNGIMFETMHRRKDGTVFPVEVNSQGVNLGDERVILSVIRDITKRKKIESELRTAHQQVRDIIEFLPDATYVVDADKRIIAWNKAMEQLSGLPKEQVLGKEPLDYTQSFYGEKRPALVEFLWPSYNQIEKQYNNVLREGDTLFAEVFAPVLHNGMGKYLWKKASPLYDSKGSIVGAIESIRDVTDFKRVEENLSWEAEVNSALAELSKAVVSSDTVEDIANLVMDKGKRLTGSKYGFAGYIDEENGYLVSPTMTRDVWKICSIPDKDIVFKKMSGLWGWVINNKEGLLTNTPQEDYRSSGVPDGHIPVNRFLAAPAMLGERLVGVVALANSERNYNSRDLELVQRMASIYALAISRKWDEERITKINECFLTFTTDPDKNINLLTALCGELFGAASAVYNRLDNGLLCSWGQWRTPADYNPVDKPGGHICYDLIKRGGDQVLVLRNLPRTSYAKTDPNVVAGDLQTYMGQPVKLNNNYVGAICVVFKRDFIPTESDKRIMGIICSAIGVEEERKLAQIKLRQSRSFGFAVLNSLLAHIAVVDKQGNIVEVNEAWKQFGRENGAAEKTILGINRNYLEECRRAAEAGCDTARKAFDGIKAVLDGTRGSFRLEYPCHSPSWKRWFNLNVTPLSGEPGGAVISHFNITERKKHEERQDVELAILTELAKFDDLKKSIANVLDILTALFNCEAAAIRLLDGEDYTYFAHTGFSASFVQKEFSLCSYDPNGVIKKDINGNPVLECLCGKVLRNELSGNVDDSYITNYGSFLTGQASGIKDDANGPLKLEGAWRLTCPVSGYETITLIPIKHEGNNIGLLQLNSTCRNAIVNEDMYFLELISRHIASAVRHFQDAAALRESEERYRRLAENAPDVIYRISYVPEPHFEYISLAVEKLTGYTPDQFYDNNKLLCRAVYPHDRGLLQSLVAGETSGGEPVELRWQHQNGQIIWMEHRNLIIKDKDGHIVAIEGIARDITERKMIESARRERMLYDRVMTTALSIFTKYHNRSGLLEELLDLVLERLDYQAGVYYAYNEWSNVLEKLVSKPVEVGRFHDLLDDEKIKSAMLNKEIVVIDGSRQSNTLNIKFSGDNVIIIPVHYQEIMHGVIVLAAGKKISGNEVAFLEQMSVQLGITLHGIKQFDDLKTLSSQLAVRQKEIEIKNKELEYANRAKSEFLTNMSHELRTPLNSVIGFSELLERQLFGDLNDRQLEYVMDIKESGEHLLSLINDILDLSKIEAGAMELDLNDVYLPDLLHGSIRMFREKGMKKGIKLDLDIDDTISLITADSRKIKQVIFNLLSNAVKFTPEGGSVTLSAVGRQDHVLVCVSDTGIGVSEEDKDNIFKEFAQVDGSLSRRHEGTGLGLALSKKLVEMHGGEIGVESKLGVGSKFFFKLPAKQGQKDNETVRKGNKEFGDLPVINAGPGKIPLVLVVEDDDRDAMLVEMYLKNEGYRVVRAANGQEGYEMARKLHPQIITMDILMPIMDGWGLLKKLKANRELMNIPVIIISVVTDHKKGIKFGASEVLVKPFDPAILVEIMRRKLGNQLLGKPTHTILVIDDDPKAVEIITQNLSGHGYRTLKAYGGVEGINMAREEEVDLILLDLMMPEVDGFEVLRVLKQDPQLKHVPVIVLTAKILNAGDYEKLQGLVVTVKEKGTFSHTWLLSTISRALNVPQPMSDGEKA
ncbi:PAS domain S-box protein [Desulfotruncus alcoholivorax]|uniref:PAS domain S-box protein n=1 Tax=Desulfotruncus alcoholivorax TaxID=265477 RepID=UPI0003FEECDB|nr:PAS domain S-box protein [Desulfotruncus alcoholivorax]